MERRWRASSRDPSVRLPLDPQSAAALSTDGILRKVDHHDPAVVLTSVPIVVQATIGDVGIPLPRAVCPWRKRDAGCVHDAGSRRIDDPHARPSHPCLGDEVVSAAHDEQMAAILPGIGAAVGAGIGAVTGHIKGGMSNDDLKQLGAVLDKGQAGLVVLYATNMADQIAANIKAENRYVSDTIDADADQLAKKAQSCGRKPIATLHQRDLLGHS